ncbi:hypothetical protein HY626_01700 [Candidatus Uhrbacteria bacterium]|nr:hypothetical protein [Candidatus Uhrbacteria bacterium]
MKKFLILAVVGAMLVPSAAVFAQETPKSSFDVSAQCEAMVTRSQERLTANETRHAKNIERMNKSIEKLKKFVEKAQTLGADTSTLEGDIAALESALVDLAADHQAVQDNLTAMTQVDCTTMTIEEYDNQIATAKTLFEAVKENIAVIKEIRQSIKSHVEVIFDAIQSSLNTETSS